MRTLVLSLVVLVGLQSPAAARPCPPPLPAYANLWYTSNAPAGALGGPQGLAVDSEHNVYAADPYESRIDVFDQSGVLRRSINLIVDGKPVTANRLMVDRRGELYVSSPNGGGILHFTADGVLQGIWTSPSLYPMGIVELRDETFAVLNYGSRWIDHFRRDGTWLGVIGLRLDLYVWAIAVDSHDNLYVAGSNGITVMSSTGSIIARWGESGINPGQLNNALSVAIGPCDVVYVGDMNARVQAFTQDGTFLGVVAHRGGDPGELLPPWGLAVDENDWLYIADTGHHRIQQFRFEQATPATTATWGKLKTLYR